MDLINNHNYPEIKLESLIKNLNNENAQNDDINNVVNEIMKLDDKCF